MKIVTFTAQKYKYSSPENYNTNCSLVWGEKDIVFVFFQSTE